jgi:hypothetical protein
MKITSFLPFTPRVPAHANAPAGTEQLVDRYSESALAARRERESFCVTLGAFAGGAALPLLTAQAPELLQMLVRSGSTAVLGGIAAGVAGLLFTQSSESDGSTGFAAATALVGAASGAYLGFSQPHLLNFAGTLFTGAIAGMALGSLAHDMAPGAR